MATENKEMNSVSDLVEEHFARALSSVTQGHTNCQSMTTEEQYYSPPNRGIKRKQEELSPHPITPPLSTSHTPPHLTGTPSPMLTHPPQPKRDPYSKGIIVHPEFVHYLVHPNIDVFRDIPRLPGQTDRLAGTQKGWESDMDITGSYSSLHTLSTHTLTTHTSTSPWTSPTTHSHPFTFSPPPHTETQGPDLTREDLKAILELNDNVI